jgi:hypothetical protein
MLETRDDVAITQRLISDNSLAGSNTGVGEAGACELKDRLAHSSTGWHTQAQAGMLVTSARSMTVHVVRQ